MKGRKGGAEAHPNIVKSPKPLVLSSHICPSLLLEAPVKASLAFRGRYVPSELNLISYGTCTVLPSGISSLLVASVCLLGDMVKQP